MSTARRKPQEWKLSNTSVYDAAKTTRGQSRGVREVSSAFQRENNVALQKAQRNVQNTLSLRIDELETRRADLERAIELTHQEIDALTAYEQQVQEALAAKDEPLFIAQDCLKARDERIGVDLVDDEVDAQLTKEVKTINRLQGDCQSILAECKEQLRLLRAANFKMDEDLQDKYQALDIDGECAQLNTTSSTLSASSASKQLNSNLNPKDWDNYTEQNLQNAAAQRSNSEALRERIDAFLKQSDLDMLTIANAVEDAFNARIAEINEAKRASEQQLVQTQIEIQAQDRTISELEEDIAARNAPLMVTTTRLNRRAQRPNVELVNDPVHSALVQELEETEKSIEMLRAELAQAKEMMKGLKRTQLVVEEDIAVKTKSLNIDNKCMMQRQQFKYRSV